MCKHSTSGQRKLNTIIVKLFYSSELSFNLAGTYTIHGFYICQQFNHEHMPLEYNVVRIILSQSEKAHIERILKPINGTWKVKMVSICSDRWSMRKGGIFIAVTGNGPMFLNVVNAEAHTKNKYYTAEKLMNCIKVVGIKIWCKL